MPHIFLLPYTISMSKVYLVQGQYLGYIYKGINKLEIYLDRTNTLENRA